MENKIPELEPLGMLNGLPIKPCVKSGFCCTKSPCGYGEWNENKSACKYLSEPNELHQQLCLRYDWIKENVVDWEMYPAFGGGCCMPIGNQMRENVIKNIKTKYETKTNG